MSIRLAVIEDIIDASGIAKTIEEMLPHGVRGRQLSIRTLLTGMLLTLDDGRPVHLTRVHQALPGLPEAGQARLGVTADWTTGPHQLTYRQTEHTFRLMAGALGKNEPDGAPSEALQAACDQLLEASIPPARKNATSVLAAGWTDIETWSRPPRHGSTACAGPEASWGHRNSNLPGPEGEMFFGCYLSAAVMVAEENGPPVPELARRMTLAGCDHDPVRQLAAVLLRMPAAGIEPGDITGDSGYAHRDAAAWAIPLRQAGASLVQDLHPHDRGPQGTHHGAIIANGNLYCPQTPRTLLELTPLPPGAAPDAAASHDQQAAELAPAQAQPAHRRRLPPRHLPRHHRQDPLPAAPRLDDPGPGPARDPHPTRAPARLLHTADHHRRPGRSAQDPAETRLPLRRLAPLLRPAHQRRAGQLHDQRHGQQQHRPRLVPHDRPQPAHALDHLPAGRPQPAHPRRLPRPAGRERTQSSRRTTAQNPQETPHHHGGGIKPRLRLPPPQQPPRPAPASPRPAEPAAPARINPTSPADTPPGHGTSLPRNTPNNNPARMSDPNVNMKAGEV